MSKMRVFLLTTFQQKSLKSLIDFLYIFIKAKMVYKNKNYKFHFTRKNALCSRVNKKSTKFLF